MTTLASWQKALFYWNQICAVSGIIPPSHATQSQSKQLRESWVGGSLLLWSNREPCHALKGGLGSLYKQVFSSLWYLLKMTILCNPLNLMALGSKLLHIHPSLSVLFSHAIQYAHFFMFSYTRQAMWYTNYRVHIDLVGLQHCIINNNRWTPRTMRLPVGIKQCE